MYILNIVRLHIPIVPFFGLNFLSIYYLHNSMFSGTIVLLRGGMH
jgi:hypothetical protein